MSDRGKEEHILWFIAKALGIVVLFFLGIALLCMLHIVYSYMTYDGLII